MRASAVSFTVALLLASLAAPARAAEPAVIGQVKSANGQAYVVRAGERLPARVGDPVREGDGIETGPDGSIGVTLTDNTRFAAGPDTRMTIAEYRFESAALDGNLLADLQRGTLAVAAGDIQKVSPDALRVQTPRAILGVRGTEFLVQVQERGKKEKS